MPTLFQNMMPRLRMAGLALLAAQGVAAAQVSYVRELAPMAGAVPILPLAQAPVDTSDPLYDPEAANTQWIISAKYTHAFDIRTGVVADPLLLPAGLQVTEDSFASLTGVGTTAPLLRVWGLRNVLFAYDMATRLLVGSVAVPVGTAASLAEQGSHLTMIADGHGYIVDPVTGGVTSIFETNGGTELGEFSTDTFYQAYGANGLLYVLDYGNGRMQMLDPEEGFEAVGEFDLEAGAETVNLQFAIGSTGNIYLGDGAGGGSYYDWDGDYLGAFTLPGSVTGTPPLEGSASYLSTDQNGGVYVIDETGYHQYNDASVVPEPSTWALLLIGAAILIGWRGRVRARLWILTLLAAQGVALADVSYVRELAPLEGAAAILSLAQAPVNTSDPLYDPEAANTQWIISTKHTYAFDIRTGVVAGALQFPLAIQAGTDSLATLTGVGTTAPLARVWGRRNTLFTFNVANNSLVGSVVLPVGWASSLASQGSHLTMIADERGYSINPDTWAMTEIFQTLGGTELGEFSTDTHYQAYGANGLLYVLDYGNGRMQMLDPEEGFEAVGEFDLEAGAETVNLQFAIGSTGNIYLGDGAGGGSYYDWDGDYLGAFTLPGSVTGTLPAEGSASYLSTDQNGGVYVIDQTGFHQYNDASVVPEPSTWALLLIGAAVLIGWRGRVRARLWLFPLLAMPGVALAEVSYVRELSPAPTSPTLSLAQAPVNTSDPPYDPDAADTQWLITIGQIRPFDISTGIVSNGPIIDFGLSISADSAAALSNVGTAAPLLRILNTRSFLYTFDPTTGLQVKPVLRIPVGVASSLAAQGSHLNVIADGYGYSVDPDTGDLTSIFETNGGTELGEFSTDTFYQAYGANGLLYVLDYGNGRMQMLDPEEGFEAVGEFDLEAGAETVNLQFAIGSTGNIYLGDGAGGGSYYDWDGDYLGAFTLPGSVTGTPPAEGSGSYLSTDQNGGVYVIDETGFHQYNDASVVPEPSTWALLLIGAAGLWLMRRRIRIAR